MKVMKNKGIIIAALVCLLTACSQVDEEPPARNQVSSTTTYTMPYGIPMSSAERIIYEQKNQEYKDALGVNY